MSKKFTVMISICSDNNNNTQSLSTTTTTSKKEEENSYPPPKPPPKKCCSVCDTWKIASSNSIIIKVWQATTAVLLLSWLKSRSVFPQPLPAATTQEMAVDTTNHRRISAAVAAVVFRGNCEILISLFFQSKLSIKGTNHCCPSSLLPCSAK